MPNDTIPPHPTPHTPSAVGGPDPLRVKLDEQKVAETATFERLLGAGRDLWTDEEFERFLATARATRSERD